MKNEFTFRRANLQNESEIQFLAEIDITIPAKFDSDFPVNDKMIQDRVKFLKSASESDFFDLAIDDAQQIVGFHLVKKVPHFERFAGRVDTLWVSPKYRKSGIASTLKQRAEEWALGQNLDHLHTWVHADNSQMISINKRMGYKVVNYKMRKDSQNFCSVESVSSTKKIPTIQTERLTLRPFQLSDAKEVQRQAGNPKVAATTATIPHPYPDGAAEEWISKHQTWFEKGQAVDWAIELNETGKLIGCISLGVNKVHNRAEVGYWIGEESWSKGYCSEAAKAAFTYAFEEMKLNKITSRHMVENPASGRVMINAGMEKEGILKQDFIKNGQFVDMTVYGLLKSDWSKT